MAWAGKDTEGGKEAGAVGSCDSSLWIPHSYQAACARRAALRPHVLSPVGRANSRKAPSKGKGQRSCRTHTSPSQYATGVEKKSFKPFKLTLSNRFWGFFGPFFSLGNTSRDILNTSLTGSRISCVISELQKQSCVNN